MILSEKQHRYLFLLGLIFVVCGLPISKPIVSIGQFVLVGNFILELNFKKKINALKNNHYLIPLLGLYVVSFIWLLNSSNFTNGLGVLKRNMPLLILPITIFSSRPLDKKELNTLLYLFLSTLFVASLIGFSKYLELFGQKLNNPREIARFINPVRFGLLLSFSSCVLTYKILNRENIVTNTLLLAWFITMIFLMESLTGIITLITGEFVLIFKTLFTKKKKIAYILASIPIIISLYIGVLVYQEYQYFKPKRFYSLNTKTKYGSKYFFEKNNYTKENGHFIWANIAYKEVKDAWEKRSTIPYDSTDKKNQKIKATIFRYLTSKGYNKDQEGIESLSEKDIENIENGITNYRFAGKRTIRTRIYETLWEIDSYSNNSLINGNSLALRFEYWKTGWHIAKRHFWFGTGIGDYTTEYQNQYEIDNSKVSKKYRYLSHNQFLYFFINYGVFGFIICLVLVFMPLSFKSPVLFQVFYSIMLVSFLNESTLSTQIGISIFVVFYCILLSAQKTIEPNL